MIGALPQSSIHFQNQRQQKKTNLKDNSNGLGCLF